MLPLHLVLTYSAGMLMACQMPEGPAIPPLEDSATAYWALQLNHRAVTLSMQAPWDTVQLIMTPVSATDDTLDASGAMMRFVSLDSANVRVTPEGFVTAKGITVGSRIIATLTVGRLTYADTVWVKVVNDPSPKHLDSFSIQPPPSDSAKIAWDLAGEWPVYLQRVSSDGSEMREILVDWRSLDPQICKIDRSSGRIMGCDNQEGPIGTLRIVASAYAYGVARVDTLFLRLGYPLWPTALFESRPRSDGEGNRTFLRGNGKYEKNPDDPILVVGVGAILNIINATFEDVDLVFDDTSHVEAIFGEEGEPVNTWMKAREVVVGCGGCGTTAVYRLFTAPGDYRFRDARTNAAATIRVVDDRIGAVAQQRRRTK